MEELSQNQTNRIYSSIKSNILVIVLGSLGLIFLGVGLIQYFSPPREEVEFISEATSQHTSENSILFIDVGGEVLSPGLYELKGGSRIHDAIIAAGGFSESADREYIAQFLNLAEPVEDGAKIYIPRKSEGNVAAVSTSAFQSQRININTASASELETLTGIGVVTAGKIIDNRPYSSVDELLSKKIVGQKTFEKIEESISVY